MASAALKRVKASLTADEIKILLESDPFGFDTFCRAVQTDIKTLAFAIHTKLINLEDATSCQVCASSMSLGIDSKYNESTE